MEYRDIDTYTLGGYLLNGVIPQLDKFCKKEKIHIDTESGSIRETELFHFDVGCLSEFLSEEQKIEFWHNHSLGRGALYLVGTVRLYELQYPIQFVEKKSSNIIHFEYLFASDCNLQSDFKKILNFEYSLYTIETENQKVFSGININCVNSGENRKKYDRGYHLHPETLM